ncbi:DUF167 domain-containing protein [Candidatus Pacearchaeota archaeon]|nr:DUF167 domain-containing protein [Candidatus Pacearchaeota archaeon]
MRIKVNVRPNSGKQMIEKIEDNEYRVWLKKPAADNKANFELLKLLKKYFLKDVTLIKGKNSKDKVIEIE